MMKKLVVTAVAMFAATALAQGTPAPAKPADPAKTPPAVPAPAKTDGKPAPTNPTTPPAGAEQGPPPPAAELAAAMKLYEGKWKCDGNMKDVPPMAKAHPVKSELTTKSDLNGYWYALRYEEKKTKENPQPFVFAGFVGWDPMKKQLVRTDIDGMGMATHLSSKGWEGDKIVWAGEVMGMKTQFRETTTKKSDKEVSTLLEMAGPDGKWATLMESNCKK